MSLEIRLAHATDSGLLAELGRKTFIEAFDGQIAHDNLTDFAGKRFGVMQQAAELAQPGTRFFVAVFDRQIAGYAKLSEGGSPSCITGTHAIELERLYLYSRWQGRGIAKALLYACFAQARDLARSGVWLDVWDQNTRAQEFYRRQLFDLVGERPYLVGNETQRHLLMYRKIGKNDLPAK
ncbi:MAG: GNAT family N-acetyltransferase [Betaproteobacteria bacterium]|jgi:ribosomal protein S18 acetylase RimI-like enzyme|nr:MAG: GNAT family N-acetyltransferase [Betaproteobacteria bacterium]